MKKILLSTVFILFGCQMATNPVIDYDDACVRLNTMHTTALHISRQKRATWLRAIALNLGRKPSIKEYRSKLLLRKSYMNLDARNNSAQAIAPTN